MQAILLISEARRLTRKLLSLREGVGLGFACLRNRDGPEPIANLSGGRGAALGLRGPRDGQVQLGTGMRPACAVKTSLIAAADIGLCNRKPWAKSLLSF